MGSRRQLNVTSAKPLAGSCLGTLDQKLIPNAAVVLVSRTGVLGVHGYFGAAAIVVDTRILHVRIYIHATCRAQ